MDPAHLSSMPGTFTLRVGDDLRRYLANATLPDVALPAPEMTQQLVPDDGREHGDSYVPSDSPPLNLKDMDPVNRRLFTVPCADFDVVLPPIMPVTDIDRFQQLMEKVPLQTIQRVMHTVFPNRRDWDIHEEAADLDHELLRIFTWRRRVVSPAAAKASDIVEDTTSVVVIALPPWILSDKDFERIVNLDEFPSYGQSYAHKMRPKEKLWAKIYDSCMGRKCPWFILTNHKGWAFGTFTPEYTRAYITRVVPSSAKRPTVLEYLFNWFSTGMSNPEGYNGMKVPEPLTIEAPSRSVTPTSDSMTHPFFPPGLSSSASTSSSGSSWQGDKQGFDIASCASQTFTDGTHYTFAVSDYNLNTELQGPPIQRQLHEYSQNRKTLELVDSWRKAKDNQSTEFVPVPQDDVVSTVSTDWSNTTALPGSKGVWLGPGAD
ncbi:uncharacterized protein STEHIDRAFT_166263 [Stereum hirsutum FP-91666 SS1]|uniref:uncharacterized protein n=1 Tax=Stereum hirsutum (strain FP-91666) TaxID=721885 RepID=UPI000440C610|nr:uncharacterized protein STEHIDRAFT_166263 [Stereum hirsutum FP-91666 SS1]EIM89985.1 hypothetical protein STEHIDRAFT_166263 [Stereum hirsutum FP-91666 SS1]